MPAVQCSHLHGIAMCRVAAKQNSRKQPAAAGTARPQQPRAMQQWPCPTGQSAHGGMAYSANGGRGRASHVQPAGVANLGGPVPGGRGGSGGRDGGQPAKKAARQPMKRMYGDDDPMAPPPPPPDEDAHLLVDF